jgi:hypothetical protein
MSETSWEFLSGPLARQTWRTELESTPTENYQQYALFDVTRVEDLMMKVYQSADLPEYEYLYSQTASKHLLDVSPVLLRLDSGDYHSLLNEAHEERAVILLTSGLSLADLAQHLRKFLLIHDGAGDSFLRFYDPACWLALESLQQTELMTGPAISEVIVPFWLTTEQPEWVCFQYPANVSKPILQSHTGYDLNTGSEFDAQCLQSRLLYWVGRHEALKGQDWLMDEFQELFDLVLILIDQGITEDWELCDWLVLFVRYSMFLSETWIHDIRILINENNASVSEVEAIFKKHELDELVIEYE